jgi:hypothetical protein
LQPCVSQLVNLLIQQYSAPPLPQATSNHPPTR